MAEDKARDRVESGDSGRECNAVIRPQGPDAARMDFFNGLLGGPTLYRHAVSCDKRRCLSQEWRIRDG